MSGDKKTPVVIALGFFDSVHLGHRQVIDKAIALAKKLNALPAVFSFREDVRAYFGYRGGEVYTAQERKKILTSLGVKNFYFAPVSKTFLNKDRRAFLDFLDTKFDIKGYVSGEDYRFGKSGLGDVDFLRAYATEKGREYAVVNAVMAGDEKISSSKIKELLTVGDIKGANALLGSEYFVTGTVFKDRQVGGKLGFPTVNIKISKQKHLLKFGVYAGKVKIGKKTYRAVINYGTRPTFGLDNALIEAHVIDYSGDLYGKTLTVAFSGYMRDIITFSDVDGLKERLTKDVLSVKDGLYD